MYIPEKLALRIPLAGIVAGVAITDKQLDFQEVAVLDRAHLGRRPQD